MSQTVPHWASRAYVALAILLGTVLVEVLLAVGSASWTTSDLLVVVVAMLALAMAAAAARSIAGPLGPDTGSPVRVHAGPSLPRGRATDPAHHPIAPRAPGLD